MVRRFKISLLLTAVLILSLGIGVQPILLVNADGNTWVSRPQNNVATISVTNPTYAYDKNPDTYASFIYSSATGKFELYNFAVPSLVVGSLPAIESVDFTMRYYAAPNTAASPDDQYRIMYYVGATPAAEPLVNWTYAARKDLYVNGFDNSKTGWYRNGTSPYLGAISYPANYTKETMGVLLRPNGNGIYTAWTGVYTDWDDVTPDGNTTFVSATADNLSESSTIENPSLPLPTGTIDKVMVTINASNPVLSNDQLNITLVIDGTAYWGHQEIFSPSASYSQIESYWLLNPATNSSWIWADINNLEAGVRSIQVGGTWEGEIRVTQMFVEVFCVDAKIGDFSFADIAPSFNVGKVEFEIYGRDMGPADNDMVQITLYDGSTWSSVGATTLTRPPTQTVGQWGWVSVEGVDITPKLNTPTKINAAKVYLTKLTVDGGRNEIYPAIEELQLDAMRLRVYSEGYLEEVTTVSWTDKPRPGGGSWTWTDISNLKFDVETSRIGGQDAGCTFQLYEAWVTVNLPNAKVTVRPSSVVDLSLKPQATKTIRPNGNGMFVQWTGVYTDWDDVTPDNDTTYVSTTQSIRRETSNLENPSHETWEIAGVRVVAYARYNTSGMDELLTLSLAFPPFYEETSEESFSLTTNYEEYSYTWAYNPRTDALWTWSDMDNLQAGVLSEAIDVWTGEMRVTQLYVEIIGPRFTVDVKAEDVTNLKLYVFTLSYETTALTAVGALSYAPFSVKLTDQIEDTITTVTNETVGTGDNSITVFELDKHPVLSGTETIYLDGVPQTRYTDYSINYETGEITFTTAPAVDVIITADYKYPAYIYVSYSMPPAPEGASGNRTLATIIFVVEDYGRSVLDLHDSRLKYVDPITGNVLTKVSDEYDGYFRNTFLSDVSGPENPPGSGLYPPDGQVDMSDLVFFDLAYGKTSTDPDWDEYKIADIRGPVGPDYLPDGVIDIWDFGYCGLEYGKSM